MNGAYANIAATTSSERENSFAASAVDPGSRYSVITGSNVHRASVMKTTSKEHQHREPGPRHRQVGVRLQQRRGAAHPGDDHRHGDRIQQHRQQHVPAARPRPASRRTASRPPRTPRSPRAAGRAQHRSARTPAPGTSAPPAAPPPPRTAASRVSTPEQLRRRRAPGDRPAPAAARAASRSGARARTPAPAPACRRTRPRSTGCRRPRRPPAAPSLTNPKANTSTHDSAKNSVV